MQIEVVKSRTETLIVEADSIEEAAHAFWMTRTTDPKRITHADSFSF